MSASFPLPSPEDALAQYRPLVEENDQAIPMLLLATDEGVELVAIQGGAPRDVLPAYTAHRAEQGEPPVLWAILTTEAWQRPVQGFADRPGTGEDIVVAVAVEPDGPGWSVIQKLQRTPAGVVWEEPTVMDDRIGGAIHSLLTRLVAP